jgi:activator of HSP90 ATPase
MWFFTHYARYAGPRFCRGPSATGCRHSFLLLLEQKEIFGAADSCRRGSTGSKATISNKIGGKFTAWDGYISGKTVALEKNKKIIQKWRTTEFNAHDKDSILEITIEEINKNRSKLTFKHTDLPEGTEEEYKNGWKEYYIKPLKEYFITK